MTRRGTPHIARALIVLASLATGCHTTDAVRRLSAPSPIYEMQVAQEREPGSLRYRVRYGDPPPIDVVLPIFQLHQSVSDRGSWPAPREATLCAATGDGEVARLAPGSAPAIIRGSRLHDVARGDLDTGVIEALGCRYLLVAESRDGALRSVALHPTSGGPLPLELPQERPLAEPGRWAWLAVSPVLDAVSLVVTPLAILIVVAMEPFF